MWALLCGHTFWLDSYGIWPYCVLLYDTHQQVYVQIFELQVPV